MESSFLAFFGHVNIDVSIRVPRMPKVGSVNATDVKENYGGTAGNFAIIAKKLGLQFDLYSAVSPKTHTSYLDYLSSAGIGTSHVDVMENSYGPVCYIPSDGEDQIAYVFQGPMDKWSPAETYQGNTRYEWVHFSTGPPRSYAELFDRIPESKVTFDPGQEIHYRYDREITSRFIERADMFIGNEAEYSKLKEITGWNDEKIHSSIDTIIITRGTKGVSAYRNGESKEFPVVKANRVHDTIGAGDSFRAGLYTGIYKGMDVMEAIRLGTVVSSKAIENPITEFSYSYEEVRSLLGSGD